MERSTTTLLAGIVALSLLGPPSAHAGDDPAHWSAKTFDAIVLRPLGSLATVAGFVFFVCSTPLAGVSGKIPTAWDVLVMNPADYTFRRPLGDF